MKIGTYEVEVLSNTEARVGCQRVTFNEASELLSLMKAWKPAPKLKVGDFVRVLENERGARTRGKFGKVVAYHEPTTYYAVEFAERIEGSIGCSANGVEIVPKRHGEWMYGRQLEKVD